MTRTRHILSTVCLLLMLAAGTPARGAHWTVDARAYQYDMTAYVRVGIGQQAGYEVAAFCGDECRGVGKLLTAGDGTQVFQLRIRSNEASGETITFRVYDTAASEELYPQETVTFQTLDMAGTPSAPLVLTGFRTILLGDVNGDGSIDSGDVMAIYNAMAGNGDAALMNRADVNGDGNIDSGDVMAIYSIMAGN